MEPNLRGFAPIAVLVLALSGCSEEVREPSIADQMPAVGPEVVAMVEVDFAPYQPISVTSSGSRVDIVMNEDGITETLQRGILTALCVRHYTDPQIDLSSIGEYRIWTRDKSEGFGILTPGLNCEAVRDLRAQEVKDHWETQVRKLTAEDRE